MANRNQQCFYRPSLATNMWLTFLVIFRVVPKGERIRGRYSEDGGSPSYTFPDPRMTAYVPHVDEPGVLCGSFSGRLSGYRCPSTNTHCFEFDCDDWYSGECSLDGHISIAKNAVIQGTSESTSDGFAWSQDKYQVTIKRRLNAVTTSQDPKLRNKATPTPVGRFGTSTTRSVVG